jgi:hypothetical protein
MLDRLPEASLNRHVGILGTSDAGKTYAAKGEVELLLDASRRVCVIDPKGVWWGLRLALDGKTPSPYPVAILGGLHGDVELDSGAGRALAETVSQGDFSCVIDTRLLPVSGRTRLFADFAERMAEINTRPLHLVIDEAHLFAPKGRVHDFEAGRMLAAANELVSGGRSQGLRVMLLTQRPAKLHNDALSQVQTLVAMLNVGPHDRAAVKEWITQEADPKAGREILDSLPSLPVGEGWIWAPRLKILEKVKFRLNRTFDSSATPTNDEPAEPRALKPIDIALLRAALAPAPTDEAQSPKSGKGAKAAAPADPAILETAKRESHAAGLAEGLRRGVRTGIELGLAASQSALNFLNVEEIAARAEAQSPAELVQKLSTPSTLPKTDRIGRHPKLDVGADTGAKPSVKTHSFAERFAQAVARYGERGLTDLEIGIAIGLLPNNGAYYGARKSATEQGWVLKAGERYRSAETLAPNPLTRSELLATWAGLKKPAIPMLEAILAGGSLTDKALEETTGIKSGNGHWYAGLAALRKVGLITTVDGVHRPLPLLAQAPTHGSSLPAPPLPPPRAIAKTLEKPAAPHETVVAPAPASREANLDGALPEAAEKVLNCARHAFRPVTWAEACVLVGMLPVGPRVDIVRRDLREAGWTEPTPNDLWDGISRPSLEALLEELAPKLTTGKNPPIAAAGFRLLARSGPISRMELFRALNMSERGPRCDHLWSALRKSSLTVEFDDGDALDVLPIIRELRGTD